MELKILGLDPGLASTGWGVIACDTDTHCVRLTTDYGVWKTQKWQDKGKKIEIPMRERLDDISQELTKIIADIAPKFVVMEDFVYFGNRGATTSIMPALIENIRLSGKAMGYNVSIYTNAYWKKKLLGIHTANKHQVAHYVTKKLALDPAEWKKLDKGGHICDALALALTHHKLVIEEPLKNANSRY